MFPSQKTHDPKAYTTKVKEEVSKCMKSHPPPATKPKPSQPTLDPSPFVSATERGQPNSSNKTATRQVDATDKVQTHLPRPSIPPRSDKVRALARDFKNVSSANESPIHQQLHPQSPTNQKYHAASNPTPNLTDRGDQEKVICVVYEE